MTLGFFDIFCPAVVAFHRINAQTDNFAVSLRKFRGKSRHIAQFGCTNWREVFRVGK